MRQLVTVLLIALVSACGRASDADGPRPAEAREIREVRELDAPARPGSLLLPNAIASVKFAVIGDSGRGNQPQYEIAQQMQAFHNHFPYTFVIMNGDNIYQGPASPEDYRDKFEKPYQPLLAAGVKFYAALGNHDDPKQVYYKPFNMGGHRYYTFRPPEDPITRLMTSVRFFAIDTTTLDRQQLRWIDEQLSVSDSAWKICFFHHPMYTSGRYRQSSTVFRLTLEPMFVKYGVDAAFAGHDHFYERTTLQQGILHFVSGGAGSLREGDAAAAPFIARNFDNDYHFMLVEIERDRLSFQVISRTGATVDAGALHRRRAPTAADTADLPQSGVRVP